jgi:hypothetical protein
MPWQVQLRHHADLRPFELSSQIHCSIKSLHAKKLRPFSQLCKQFAYLTAGRHVPFTVRCTKCHSHPAHRRIDQAI